MKRQSLIWQKQNVLPSLNHICTKCPMSITNNTPRPTKYWIVVASKDHVETGKTLGIVQANHGKSSPMKRMKPGDLIVFYSPKLQYQGNQPYKRFTAIARVREGEVYQGDMGGGF